MGIMPQDLVQALTLTLDWALLASYRVAFENLRQRNQLADALGRLQLASRAVGDTNIMPQSVSIPRPIAMPTVIAPEQIMPLDWIVDYERATHLRLFELGRADTQRALRARG